MNGNGTPLGTYFHQETQTWELTGAAPTGNIYPATWKLSGAGNDNVGAPKSWTVSANIISAPMSILQRASDQAWLISISPHFQITGLFATISDRPSTTVAEYGLPTIVGAAASNQIYGSTSINDPAGRYGVLQPNGPTSQINCAWRFARGSFPPPSTTPLLISMDPATATAGGPGFDLTLSGTQFQNGASVRWNGVARTTTFVNIATLRASIPATDIASVGSALVSVANPSPSGTSNELTFSINATPGGGSHFIPIPPCRAADTRTTSSIAGGTSRAFGFGVCGVPANATALSLNVTAVPGGSLGYLSLWPTGSPQPAVSTLNSIDGRIKANAAITGAGTNGQVSVFVTDTAHVILDVTGYFAPVGTPNSLSFFPARPCRVIDTRVSGSGGILASGETRLIPGDTGLCLPSAAAAYSLNVTVVPPGPLGYLTLFPNGIAQPVVSTLNALTGTVTANAALLRAGAPNGAINAFVNGTTHLIADFNGAFEPPASFPGGYAFYPLAPCRIGDTRNTNGPFGGPRFEADSSRQYDLTASGCGVPANARAVVLNATVVPPGVFGFLTLWAPSQNRPTVSTLNAVDGALTSNMAIVPVDAGVLSAYTSSATHLLLDVTGYFAP